MSQVSNFEISGNNSKLYEQDGFIITREGNQLIYALSTKEKIDILQATITPKNALQYSKTTTIRIPSSVFHIEKQTLSEPDVVSVAMDGVFSVSIGI